MATSARSVMAFQNALQDGSPQQKLILTHLRDRRSAGLSQFEALHLYRIAALPRRIADLKDKGVDIRTERRLDPTRRPYSRYFLEV